MFQVFILRTLYKQSTLPTWLWSKISCFSMYFSVVFRVIILSILSRYIELRVPRLYNVGHRKMDMYTRIGALICQEKVVYRTVGQTISFERLVFSDKMIMTRRISSFTTLIFDLVWRSWRDSVQISGHPWTTRADCVICVSQTFFRNFGGGDGGAA